MASLLSKEKVQLVLDNTKATLLMEGLVPDEETVALTQKYLTGEITEEEALNKLKVIAGKYISK
jgi:hypothetical protein